jgi:DNA polymerase III alpha subunit
VVTPSRFGRPDGLDDVVQALALLRPGAASIGMKELFVRRRHGLESAPLAHPALQITFCSHAFLVHRAEIPCITSR